MSKINRNKIEQFLQWEGGQRLFNFAYSIGAAVVILGALFKILHLQGGNTLLMVGMGTEVLMFILTAFDSPPREYKWEEVFPALRHAEAAAEEALEAEAEAEDALERALAEDDTPSAGSHTHVQGGGGTLVIGNLGSVGAGATAGTTGAAASGPIVVGGSADSPVSADDAAMLSEAIHRMSEATEAMTQMADLTAATRDYMMQMATISQELHRLGETTRSLNAVSEVLLDSYRAITENSENITRSSSGYVKEMEALNNNVSGLNTIYEIQLRSVSGQLDSIDRVNRGIKDIRDMYEKSAGTSARYMEETEKMARYMQQLNQVYENMIHAMTVNMYRPGFGGPVPPQADAQTPSNPQ